MSTITPCGTPPLLAPSAFDMGDAQTCAALTVNAYDLFDQWVQAGYPGPNGFPWKLPDSPAGFTYSGPLWGNARWLDTDHWEPFGFVAWDGKGNAYVVYRGTMTTADKVNDADVSQVPYGLVTSPGFGNVHAGFYSIYTLSSSTQQSLSAATLLALQEANDAAPITTLYFTGHSMGASLVTLALPDAVYNFASTLSSPPALLLYNFASPRVGDVQFACAVNQTIGAKAQLYRVVNTEDLVPTIPPAAAGSLLYEHVGAQATFTAHYLSIVGNHSMANCYTYAVNNPGAPQGPVVSLPNVVTGEAMGYLMVPAAATVSAP